MQKMTSRTWHSGIVVLALALTGALAQAAPKASQRNADGDSGAYEAVAARQADKQGQLTTDSPEQLARNAVARCSVFKTDEDKRACVDRSTTGQGSGSVESGGVLTEYSYSVPVKP